MSENIHATALALKGHALLLLGSSGSGKSDLALRLMDRSWGLIADDRVDLEVRAGRLFAHCPPALAGKIEVRGLGILTVPTHPHAPVALAISLRAPERLPDAAHIQLAGVAVPHFCFAPFEASAPLKVEQALALTVGALG